MLLSAIENENYVRQEFGSVAIRFIGGLEVFKPLNASATRARIFQIFRTH